MRDLPHEAAEFAKRRVQALRRAVGAEVADINRAIAHVLRGGLLLSVGVLLAGLAIAAAEGAGFPSRVVEPDRLLDPLLHLRPEGLLSLGVLVLILTPVVRVSISLLGFLKERDWMYVPIAAMVLLNLSLAFLIGVI